MCMDCDNQMVTAGVTTKVPANSLMMKERDITKIHPVTAEPEAEHCMVVNRNQVLCHCFV